MNGCRYIYSHIRVDQMGGCWYVYIHIRVDHISGGWYINVHIGIRVCVRVCVNTGQKFKISKIHFYLLCLIRLSPLTGTWKRCYGPQPAVGNGLFRDY